MKKTINLSGLLLVVLAVNACAIATKHVESATPEQLVQQAEQKEKNSFEAANVALKANKFEKSLEGYQDFQKEYPRSVLFLAARLGEAESLEGLERWSEALEIYKSVYDVAVNAQPEIAAIAVYRTSFCYEALGDDIKAVAALLDSLKKKDKLSEEIARAEIPARLSMLYGKQQNFDESNKFIAVAQKGISELQGRPDISPVTLAKAYFQMGSVSMNQMSSENLSEAVRAQKVVQVYLLKAMGMNVDPWSPAAADKLKKNYRDLWNVFFEMPGLAGADPEALERNRRVLQVSYGAEILDLIQTAEYYRPLDAKKMNKIEVGFFAYLDEVKKRVEENTFRAEEFMTLTPESQKLNALKRPGRIRDSGKAQRPPVKGEAKLPAKKNPPAVTPPPIGTDPNL